jgi:hypothetical protein
MRRPTWATVVGIMGIVFGVMGLFGAAQTAMMPVMIKMQGQMMDAMAKSAPTQTPQQQVAAQQMQQMMNTIWGDVPPWLMPAAIALGGLTLLVNGIYIFAAISLLQMRPYSITLLYAVLTSSIVMGLVRGSVFVAASPMMGMFILFYAMAGVAIDVTLLIVIATGDKTAFAPRLKEVV